MRIRAIALAKGDVSRAARYFESKRIGFGFRFLQSYYTAFDRIKQFPELNPPVVDGHPPHEIRNAILDRFDYRIIYLVRSDEVVILAVAHTSRRPKHWHRRLDDPAL